MTDSAENLTPAAQLHYLTHVHTLGGSMVSKGAVEGTWKGQGYVNL